MSRASSPTTSRPAGRAGPDPELTPWPDREPTFVAAVAAVLLLVAIVAIAVI